MDTPTGEWFSGYTLIFIILAFLSPFTLITRQFQRVQDIELGELPSFVNPELVREWLSNPIQPNIDFPPAAHLRRRRHTLQTPAQFKNRRMVENEALKQYLWP
jgi:hypothetical protein